MCSCCRRSGRANVCRHWYCIQDVASVLLGKDGVRKLSHLDSDPTHQGSPILVNDRHQAHKYSLIPGHQHCIRCSGICKLLVELVCRLLTSKQSNACLGPRMRHFSICVSKLLPPDFVVVPNTHVGQVAEELVADLFHTSPIADWACKGVTILHESSCKAHQRWGTSWTSSVYQDEVCTFQHLTASRSLPVICTSHPRYASVRNMS